MSAAERLDLAGIGSMVVDRIHRTARVLGAEEKGVLRVFPGGKPTRTFVGGVVLNQLGWATALGLRTAVFGKQADDEGGRFLRAAMDRLGIERDLVLDGSASSVSEIYVDDAGGRAIYMAPGATAETTAEHVRRHHAQTIQRATRVVTEVSQLPLGAALETLQLARAAGAATVLDLDVPPSDAVPALGGEAELRALLEAADLLKPAKAAAAELAPEAGRDALELARALRRRFGNPAVVVTDGEAGCAVAAEGFEGRVRAYATRVLDTTGAGDAFLGGLLAGLHAGLDWEDAARLANACGATCVEQLGAFPNEPVAARTRALELYDGAPVELRPAPEPRRQAPLPPAESGDSPALAAFDVVLEELAALRRRLDGRAIEAAVDLIRAAQEKGGRVHVTGVGKPEHVAHYAASLFASTGTSATFLHGTEVIHGSAGQVLRGDVVIAVSNSGETVEMSAAVQTVRALGARIIAVTGHPESWLARNADVVLDAGVAREGGGLGLAPRASFAAEVLVMAALSAALEAASGFTRADYHARHPAGILGQRSRGS